MGAMKTPWKIESFRSYMSNTVSKFSRFSIGEPKSLTWMLHRYPSLRSSESVLPKPMEILADAEKYASFHRMKDTIIIRNEFGFLETVEHSTSFVDRLPIFGNVSLITKRLTISCLPYLAEDSKKEKSHMNGEKQVTTGDADKIFPTLMDDPVEHANEYGVPKDTLDRYPNSLSHNVVGGKANRGNSVLDTISDLLEPSLTDEEYLTSALLRWCTELLEAALLVADDIMNPSKTRRGNTCWYLMPNLGMNTMEDAFRLVSSVFIILRKYCSGDKNYMDFLLVFYLVMFKTETSRLSNLLTAPEDKPDCDQFSIEKYRFIVNFKTSYYSFFPPATLSLYKLNLATPENLQQAEKILPLTGEYYQIQDDYFGFDVPEITGKIGTDIQDNKCSWLINEGFESTSPQQRKVLEDNCGQEDESAEARVKEACNEMDLEGVYCLYEDEELVQMGEAVYEIDGGDLRDL